MATERPEGAEAFDVQYWRAFRERARERASKERARLLGLAMMVMGALLLVVPVDYRAGGIPIEPPFTLLFPGLFLAIGLGIAVHAARWLRGNGRAPG